MSKCPVVYTALCGRSLRRSALVMGWFYLVCDAIILAMTLIFTCVHVFGISSAMPQQSELFWITIALSWLLWVAGGIMEIVGVYRKRPEWLRMWCVLALVRATCNFMLLVVWGIIALTYSFTAYGFVGWMLGALFQFIMFVDLLIYFSLVVYSLSREMRGTLRKRMTL